MLWQRGRAPGKDNGQSWGLKMAIADSMARGGNAQTRVPQEADEGPHGQ